MTPHKLTTVADTYDALLEQGIDGNPAGFDESELASLGRAVLSAHYKNKIVQWREIFGTRQANGRASSQLSEVAKSAWSGQVDQLLFDLDHREEGTIDDFGNITVAAEPSAETYRLVDEVAAQVLRTGGKVRAVRRDDLPDDSPIAALLRGGN